MNRYAVLLRGINVGGNMTVSMPLLKQLLTHAGYAQVETYLNSGNVVLETAQDKPTTEASIQQLIAQHFGLTIAVFALSAEELTDIVHHNPFDTTTEADNSKRMVVIFRESIAADTETTIIKDKEEDADYYLRGKTAYIYYKVGAGRAKIKNPSMKQLFKQVSTARNWNTITRMLEKVSS